MLIRPLKGHGAFEAVLRNGRRFTSGAATVTVIQTQDGTSANSLEVGVMVGKRYAAKAVVRTRIRRLLRVSIRRVIAQHEAQVSSKNISVVLLGWRQGRSRPCDIHLSDVYPHVERAMLSALKIDHHGEVR